MSNPQEKNSARYSINGMALQTLMHYRVFQKTYKFLKKSQWWSSEQLEEYQLQQLKKLLHQAYENVPYYKKIFDKLNLKPKDIRSIQDLQKLPFLTKKIIKEHMEDLKAKNFPESKFELSWTGGSTGIPLYFYVEKGIWAAQLMAYNRIHMDWVKLSFFDKCVFITGIERRYAYEMFGRTLVLSSFNFNDNNFPFIIKKIQKFKPKYILGFPSAIYLIARYMKKNNIKAFPSLKMIISQAETLYEWQREFLEKMFKCPIYNRYGLRETTAKGSTCDQSRYFHMFPQYGIVELIRKDGKLVTNEDEIGEIVGTGFHTYIFPFIRYRTGDLGVYTNQKCACGRNFPLLKRIEGRLQEVIVSKTNQLIPIIGTFGLIAKISSNVKECQLYQDAPGEVMINILRGKNYSDNDTKIILENFQKKFGDKFLFSVCFVDKIPRTRGGKFKFLIQKLPVEFIA